MADKVQCSEVTQRLRRAFIRLDHVDLVLGRLTRLFEQDCRGAEPEHLMLLGEPGMGKTTLLRYLAAAYPRKVHETFTEVPVVYLSVPSKCSNRKLASAILRRMGSPFWNNGDEWALTCQLEELMRACKVKLIILDEANHLVDRGAFKSHEAVADWIKDLATAANVPFVLAGVGRTKTLLEVNEQLGDRFREVLTMAPLSLEEGERRDAALSALQAFAGLLKGVSCIDLTSSETARLVVFATGGRLRPLRKLLVRAVELAFGKDRPKIDLDTLATAFKEVIYQEASDARNPFSKKFSGVPLIKSGEPFAPEAAGRPK